MYFIHKVNEILKTFEKIKGYEERIGKKVDTKDIFERMATENAIFRGKKK